MTLYSFYFSFLFFTCTLAFNAKNYDFGAMKALERFLAEHKDESHKELDSFTANDLKVDTIGETLWKNFRVKMPFINEVGNNFLNLKRKTPEKYNLLKDEYGKQNLWRFGESLVVVLIENDYYEVGMDVFLEFREDLGLGDNVLINRGTKDKFMSYLGRYHAKMVPNLKYLSYDIVVPAYFNDPSGSLLNAELTRLAKTGNVLYLFLDMLCHRIKDPVPGQLSMIKQQLLAFTQTTIIQRWGKSDLISTIVNLCYGNDVVSALRHISLNSTETILKAGILSNNKEIASQVTAKMERLRIKSPISPEFLSYFVY